MINLSVEEGIEILQLIQPGGETSEAVKRVQKAVDKERQPCPFCDSVMDRHLGNKLLCHNSLCGHSVYPMDPSRGMESAWEAHKSLNQRIEKLVKKRIQENAVKTVVDSKRKATVPRPLDDKQHDDTQLINAGNPLKQKHGDS